MASNNIVKADENTKRVLAILRTTIPSLGKVDDETAFLAIAYARHIGLDPLKKEIHLIPYWDKEQGRYVIQPVVAYTEYLKRAEASGKLDGWEIEIGTDEKHGRYAEVTIHRKDFSHPLKWRVYENEVKKDTKIWEQQPLFMLRKVAIAQAFRIAFPTETAELPYEEAEQWEPEVIKVTEEMNGKEEVITEAQRRRFFAILKKLGYEDMNYVKSILKERWGIESSSDIPKSKYDEIIEYFKNNRPVNAG